MKFSFRNRLSIILSFAVSAGLVTWLITRMDFTRAIDLLRQAQGHWLAPAVCLAVLIPFCSTCRWVEVVRVHDDLKYPVTLAWRGVMFSYALNSFLPSKAGDFVKAFYFRNTGGISLAVLAGLVPITVGGIGTWDSAFLILLTGHLTTEGATLVALGYTVLAYWLIGLLGVPVALREIVAFLRNRPGQH